MAELMEKKSGLEMPVFDPRYDVSADAKYVAGRIVWTLWIILVLIPAAIGFLYVFLHNGPQ